MLRNDERIAEEPLRVRFVGFGEYDLKIEINAYALTSAWAEFLEIREDLLLKVMDIVERSGTHLALPTGVRYVSERHTDGDSETPNDAADSDTREVLTVLWSPGSKLKVGHRASIGPSVRTTPGL